METVLEGASKRPLDEDDNGDKKKLKTGPDLHQVLPTLENMKNEKDDKKWNLLPSIVYELLALFKDSENVHSDKDKQVCKRLVHSLQIIIIYKNNKLMNRTVFIQPTSIIINGFVIFF